jgi:hypothetical protein
MKRPQFAMGAEVHRWAAKVNAAFLDSDANMAPRGSGEQIGWAHLLEI